MPGSGKDIRLVRDLNLNHNSLIRDVIAPEISRRRAGYKMGIHAIDRISQGSFKRLARRGGVKRMGSGCVDEMKGQLTRYLQAVLKDAVILTTHSKRNTVSAEDVVRAVRRQGRTLYGF